MPSPLDRALRTARVQDLRRRLPYRAAMALDAALVAADPQSLRTLLQLPREPAGGPARPVRLRTLGGATVHLRPGTSDPWVAKETLPPAAHLPPPEVDRDAARTVWDLGANIGMTMAHLATALPQARVYGVELDPQNAELARRNTAAFGDRCTVVDGGVAPADGTLTYGSGGDDTAVAFRVGEGDQTAPAVSLDTLLERSGGGPVDYVKMDIEGAERDVLKQHTAWAAAVRAITLEVHPPYPVDECRSDLEALGFTTRVAVPKGHGMTAVTGVRRA